MRFLLKFSERGFVYGIMPGSTVREELFPLRGPCRIYKEKGGDFLINQELKSKTHPIYGEYDVTDMVSSA
jgi:hypothetical protein